MNQRAKDIKWVVKSSSQILGPYATEEVIDLIKKKSIIPIDEIIPESGNWSYVRDVALFQSALSQQSSSSGVEVTKTQNLTSTFTDDMTSTELLDETEELSTIDAIDYTNPNVNGKVQPIRSSQLPKPGLENFVTPQAKKQNRISKSKLIGGTLSLVVILFIGFLLKDTIKSLSIKLNGSDIVNQSKYRFSIGDYVEAYSLFQEINQNEVLKKEIKGFYVQFAALVLNQERQTVYARDLLEKERPLVKNTPEWLTTMGLSYLIDQNYTEAEKFLNRSIKLNPDFLPAWVNLGHLYLNQNRYQEAWDFFYSAYLRGYIEGHISVFMAISLIEQWRVNSDINNLTKALDLVTNFLSSSADRRQINIIIKVWLLLKTGYKNKSDINNDVLVFIESDPYLLNQFKSNVYEHSYDNKRFENYCADIISQLPAKKLNTLLFSSLCYYNLGFTGRITAAPIEVAEQLYPKETLVFAIQSVISDNKDETYQKSLLIGRALSSDVDSKFLLPLILQARFCELKNDLVCAAKYWKTVNDRDRLKIGAYNGFARYYLSKKENIKAKKWISDGLMLSSSYKPLLEIDK